MSPSLRRSTVSLLAVCLPLVLAGPASAATFTVDDRADAPDAATGNGACATAAGDCTLRAAVQEANELDGEDLVELPAGTYALTVQGADEDLAATGDLDLLENVRIVGAGSPTVNAEAVGDRVFDVGAEAEAELEGLVVSGGSAIDLTGPFEASGGGILNRGSLLLTRSRATRNLAFIGGGVANFGRLDVVRSTIGGAGGELGDPDYDGNGANLGGGLAEFPFGPPTQTVVRESTISGNAAVPIITTPVGGGAFAISPLLVENSTVSGNQTSDIPPFGTTGVPSTDGVGGGLGAFGGLDLSSTTVNANAADQGANVASNAAGPLATAPSALGRRLVGRMQNGIRAAGFDEPVAGALNTIVANGERGANCAGTLTSGGHNLEFDADTPPSCGFAQPTDLNGRDPLLGALTDNGGPTATHALADDSPAIDAGDDAECPDTDQRGEARADGDGNGSVVCDIGAFEAARSPADLNLDITAPDSLRDGQRFSYTSSVRNDGPGGAPGAVLGVRLSPRQRFVAASAGCTYTGSSRTVTCDLGVIPGGATRSVGITVEATEPGSVSADGTATSDAPDPRAANNREIERATVRGGGGTDPGGAEACTIRGTAGNDVIVGTPAGEVVCGGAGNDVIVGRGGEDTIRGGGGNDVLRGDEGDDELSGGDGNDVLNGGPGADRLSGGSGNDSLAGSDGVQGNDTVDGGADRDTCGRDPGDARRSCP